MSEIVRIDQVGLSNITDIKGITKYNDSTVFVCGEGSRNLASFSLNYDKLYDGPNYDSRVMGKKLRSITAEDNLLFAVVENEFKILTISNVGSSELKVYDKDTNSFGDLEFCLLRPLLELLPKCTEKSFSLKQIIIVCNVIYFFVQTEISDTKRKLLFILEGSLNRDQRNVSINKNIKFQTFYDLYKTGRLNGLSRTHARTMKFGGVTYNKNTNKIILLIRFKECGKSGFLFEISKYDQINEMSSKLKIIKTLNENPLILKNDPSCIIYLQDNNYMVVSDNKVNGLINYFIVRIV